jgi:hypothetical protein
MASIIANGPGTPMIPRGKPVNVGTLPVNASTTAVQFTVSNLVGNPNGFDTLVIFTVGGTVGTPVLECSIDGGATWATVVAPTNASSSTTFTNSAFGGDTAVSSAQGYTIAGLQGYALFRWGAAVTVAPTAVWIAIAG